MLETIAGGLIVATFTGTVVLAYQRPEEYWWVASKLMVLGAISLFLFFAFEIGYSKGAADQLALDGIPGTKHKTLGEMAGTIAIAASFILNMYLGFLPMVIGALKRETGKP